MTNENQNLKKSRKINLQKTQYELPYIDEDRYILDQEYEGEQTENTSHWLDSLSTKSQYDITESLAIAVW